MQEYIYDDRILLMPFSTDKCVAEVIGGSEDGSFEKCKNFIECCYWRFSYCDW